MKKEFDKYYTDEELAKELIALTYKFIGKDNISEIIEPSAGDGSFSRNIENCIAYDIEPNDESIIKQDFLKLELGYKKGRLFIGNPPFGEKLNLANKFFKKCVSMGDYIAFVLPISQLNNTNSFFEFDLLHSVDLGNKLYSNVNLHCCFNIYKRPNGSLNKKPKIKLEDITIIRQDSKKYQESEYDLRMCYWGNGSAGKLLSAGENYSAEYKIIVNNKELKEEVIKVLSEVNWREELNCIAMLKIQQFHIINLLKRKVKNIK